MSSIIKVDTIQDQAGNNIISESANVITIGASGDTITVPAGATVSGFTSAGIDDNATSTAITIDSSENVGIGTTTMDGKLHIQSNSAGSVTAHVNGSLGVFEASGNNGISILTPDASTSAIFFGSASSNRFAEIKATYDNNFLDIGTRKSGGLIRFATDNFSERMRIDSSGNVGIGTTSPANNLDIVASEIGDIGINITNSLSSNGGHSASVNLISENANSDLSDATKGAIFVGGDLNNNNFQEFAIATESNTPIVFVTNGDGNRTNNVLTNERMRIDSSGNVGIGTTSPTGKLNISTASTDGVNTLFGANVSPTAAGMYVGFNDSDATATLGVYYASSPIPVINITRSDRTIKFMNDASERMRINSSGNVGIGETSPLGKLHVKNGDTGASSVAGDKDELVIENNGHAGITTLANDSYESGMFFGHASNTRAGEIYTHYTNQLMTIGTRMSGGAVKFISDNGTERMRIASDGVVGIGTSSPSSSYRLSAVGGTGAVVGAFIETTSTDSGHEASIIKRPNSGVLVQFLGSGQVGSITTNGSTTTYGTSSDYRLKENVVDLNNATERLKQLQPKRFNFISDADTTVDGFIAHEVSSVVPEAIHGTKDEVDANGNPKYQNIDQSKLVPLLVKTIQELEARITTLEANNP